MRSWMWIAVAAVVFGAAFLWLGGDPTVKRGGPGSGAASSGERADGKAKVASLGERQTVGAAALRRGTPDAAHLRDLAARQKAMQDAKAGSDAPAAPTPPEPPPQPAPAAPATP